MSDKMQKFMQDYIDAWNSHDWNKVAPFFLDDGIMRSGALGTVYHGKQELKPYFESVVAGSSDFKIEIQSQFYAGEWGACEIAMSGTCTGDKYGIKAKGNKYSIECASIFEFRNGKIKRHADYWNLFIFLQQIGIMQGQ
jgi:steroid delta-isomerase-like uncharacterized protein